MSTFLDELKRRKVFRVSGMYFVAAWLLVQVGDTVFEPLGMPEGSLRLLIIATLAGFPFAVALGWVFDWTEKGIVRTPARQSSVSEDTSHKSANYPLIIGSISSVLVLVLSYGGYRGYDFYLKVQWAQNEAQPQLIKLIEENDFFRAFELAEEIEEAVGKTPALEPAWQIISAPVSFTTEPAGAKVSYRRYDDPRGPWKELGVTPITETFVPRSNAVWKIEKPGFVTRIMARSPTAANRRDYFRWPAHHFLDEESSAPANTVAIEGGTYVDAPLAGLQALQSFDTKRFFLDKTEVTNQDYQEFVDAGGYQRDEYWPELLGDDLGGALDFSTAMARLLDSTGRAGPSTWIGGRFPEGKADHPVAGVSWYEAAAYARFRGRHLPTIFHWAVAALPDSEIVASLSADLAAQSNVESTDTVPVGSTTGVSAFGAADMFGNVSEWVWNSTKDNQRFTLGLGWSGQAYNVSIGASASPWSRLPDQGFRLATYPDGAPETALAKDMMHGTIDYDSVASLSEDAYKVIVSTYPKSLSTVQASEQAVALPNGYSATKVEVNYPFSDKKLPIFLLIPDNAKPPYQTVVWFGGINSLFVTNNDSLFEHDMNVANFLRQSGRVIVMPIWEGTFSRNDGSALQKFRAGGLEQQISNWQRDITYTLDYLSTRADIDANRIAYVGLSFGSNISPYFLHYQSRFKTAVLWSGGIFQDSTPEAAVLTKTLLKRVEIPTLMINGRHDYVIPLDSQEIFFNLLGTPSDDKKHVVFNSGHSDWPIGAFVKENLDWLDKYLGPVEKP